MDRSRLRRRERRLGDPHLRGKRSRIGIMIAHLRDKAPYTMQRDQIDTRREQPPSQLPLPGHRNGIR